MEGNAMKGGTENNETELNGRGRHEEEEVRRRRE